MKVFANLKPDSFWLLAFVTLWMAISVATLIYVTTTRLVVFDQLERISKEFPLTQDYLAALEVVFAGESNTQPRMLRLVDPTCRCNVASLEHWQILKNQYLGITYREVDIRTLSETTQVFIPATPMAIFFNSEQQVLYAGPFSGGAYCGSKNSLIEAYAAQRAQTLFAPLQTQGCYCPNPAS